MRPRFYDYPLEQIAALVNARGPFPPWVPRYNQPPGEPVANVIEANGVRRIEAFHWGIRGRDPKRPYVNVRGESVPKSRALPPFTSREQGREDECPEKGEVALVHLFEICFTSMEEINHRPRTDRYIQAAPYGPPVARHNGWKEQETS